jgi:hypothetical protein
MPTHRPLLSRLFDAFIGESIPDEPDAADLGTAYGMECSLAQHDDEQPLPGYALPGERPAR